MSWKTDNWTKRIFNVFKRSKSTIYPEDIEAFKSVLNELKQHENKYINDNILFLKLLTIHLHQNLEYYGNIGNAISQTKNLLNDSLVNHIERLRINLNNNDLNNYFESIGLVDWKTKTEKELNTKIIKENQKEMLDKVKKNWTIEQVEKALYNSANDFLKDVENYE